MKKRLAAAAVAVARLRGGSGHAEHVQRQADRDVQSRVDEKGDAESAGAQ